MSAWNPESVQNVLGRTKYLDDLPEPAGLLHGHPVVSKSAHGRLLSLDDSAARALHPSVRMLTARDIPGENQLGVSVPDEPLLVSGEWTYRGQSLALVLAATRSLARRAAALVRISGEELPVVTDAREAAAKGMLILKPRTMRRGDPENAFQGCALVVSGRIESAGQEHVYLETQGAVAQVRDGGGVFVLSGTQSPTGVQEAVARNLGLPMNAVEVEAPRLGGAFGGKEDQAAAWASLAALGAYATGRPVKVYLNRKDDIAFTGKRHPYSTDYRMGLDGDGRILAFQADYYQNSGACADLSPAILSRTLFHAAGAYYIPNILVTGRMCRTNLPPFTAFRGFGAPQGIFAMEAALHRAAEALGVDAMVLQRKNLLRPGDTFHYGMPVGEVRTEICVDLARASWDRKRTEIDDFNRTHADRKRGMAAIPLCFGVSFTKLMMNQGGALVHVYRDGSVGVNTGAVEMGQGVNRKIQKVVALTLGVPETKVHIERTRTVTVANTSPTAASTGTDLNGMAALAACEEILGRLSAFRSESGIDDASWDVLIAKAHEARVDLSAHGFYATPGLFYDFATERGSPFAYHVYGCAVITALVDTVRGTYRVDSAYVVHDSGNRIDEVVDRGQIEGALAQGLGWALLEDLRYDETGKLLSDTLSTYKLPDAHFLDFPVDLEYLADAPNPLAVLRSKAIGEPPFMYGIAGYFAVLDALKAARGDRLMSPGFHDLPMTPEKALDYLMEEVP
ncbi:MAG TPA: molybdopterin cofactor-binding domain-containing protein [Magnetospirillaceae bacterium]|nr:molybdopterin cofactor-binding domain-containing protein [Magnetospirillaceae bacterium]